jgi:hypothetical protein
MKKSSLIKLMSLYPPFLGAGIRVKKVSPDFRFIQVEMRKRFWNMLMMIENLGRGYTVWDKAASIRFKSPVTAPLKRYSRFENANSAESTARYVRDLSPDP